MEEYTFPSTRYSDQIANPQPSVQVVDEELKPAPQQTLLEMVERF